MIRIREIKLKWYSKIKSPPQYIFKCYPEDVWFCETNKVTYTPNFEMNRWESKDVEPVEFPKKTVIIEKEYQGKRR